MRHIIQTDADGFWQLFFDDQFNRALVQIFDVGWEVVEQHTDDDGMLHRRVRILPNLKLPALAKKIFGDGACTEHGRYDPVQRKYFARNVPDRGGDRFSVSTEVSAEPHEDKRCERVFVADTTVRLFGFGGAIESVLERLQREAQQRVADFTNGWIRDHQL